MHQTPPTVDSLEHLRHSSLNIEKTLTRLRHTSTRFQLFDCLYPSVSLQMLSRCFATAICNTQSGILNSTIIDEDETTTERTTKVSLAFFVSMPASQLC